MPGPAAESSAPDACTYDKFDVARNSGISGPRIPGVHQQVLRTVSKAPETVPIADTLHTHRRGVTR
jgi:hypothetical protein